MIEAGFARARVDTLQRLIESALEDVETEEKTRQAAVFASHGRMFHWAPPRAVTERFREMRQSMTGRENLKVNRTEEPRWITPPPPEAYQEELRRAGSADALPDRLRAKLAEAEPPGNRSAPHPLKVCERAEVDDRPARARPAR